MVRLGVNIDHIATLREARKINEPDPLEAIFAVKNAGAHQITIHLREDRRHINDFDVRRIIESAPLPVNVESSTNSAIIDFLIAQKPHSVTLVPENRAEITTEGGLKLGENLRPTIDSLKNVGIKVSLFIDSKIADTEFAKSLGADAIELHTGKFANLYLAKNTNLNRTPNRIEVDSQNLAQNLSDSLKELRDSAKKAKQLGLEVFAGHGLNYQNVREIVAIDEITELNIGHSIVARAVFVGLERAIKEMLDLIRA
ncbi:pyridoxine 5'-phosphate synthase [Helicobacter sp. 23-1044]